MMVNPRPSVHQTLQNSTPQRVNVIPHGRFKNMYHTTCPGNQDGMRTLRNETNCITSKITPLKEMGKKGVDINDFGKQCFDWI